MPLRNASAFLMFAAIGCSSARPHDLVVVADRMLDVETGSYVENVAVFIDGNRITGVETGTRREFPNAIRVKTLLPGLIDAHTHLAWSSAPGDDAARATVEAGFTTVRNLGSDSDADLKLAKTVTAPRMILSGPGLGPPGGICHQTFGDGAVVSSPDDARAKVRSQVLERGARVIKLCAGGGVVAQAGGGESTVETDFDTISAIVAEAHKLGVKVAAHAQSSEAIANAVNAGVDSIEHGALIDHDTALLMKAKNVTLVPTLARMPPGPNRERVFENMREAVRVGVPIVAGSDATVLPHGQNAKELSALVEIGLSPIEAIRAATTRAALLLGLFDVGLIREGYAADLVAVDGDPLTDVSALAKPTVVIASGVRKK